MNISVNTRRKLLGKKMRTDTLAYVTISVFLFFNVILRGQTACPNILGVSIDSSLANPCIAYNIFILMSQGAVNDTMLFTSNASIDFGDGSPPALTTLTFHSGAGAANTPNANLMETFARVPHAYPIPGNYLVTVTATGPGSCSSVRTTTFSVSGHCISCSTYSNLSTGFDRINNIPFSAPQYALGNPDPYWTVVKKQIFVSGVPTSTVFFPQNTPAYDIYPVCWYAGPIGTSRFINYYPTYGPFPGETAGLITFRTYFNLPTVLPTNITYSLAFSIRSTLEAGGVGLNVSLNGNIIVWEAYNIAIGGGIDGLPLDTSWNSCNSSAFQPGSNYIDIDLYDYFGPAYWNELDAEILLYACPASCNPPPSCADCISSFAPIPGKKYLISAWTKEASALQSKTSYTYPSINVLYPSISGSIGPFTPSGNIVDGWQRIEGVFTIPSNTTDMNLQLNCSTGDCYFDDVRVQPFDASMKSYVYDPVSMRLVAELDEQNYATLYEYDEEGKLIRVKKETEKGKMTIRESRDNTKK